MASAIKEPQVLRGHNARKFEEEISRNRNKHVSNEEYVKAVKLMNDVLKNSDI